MTHIWPISELRSNGNTRGCSVMRFEKRSAKLDECVYAVAFCEIVENSEAIPGIPAEPKIQEIADSALNYRCRSIEFHAG
jgi:hypothetical protein